MPKISDIDKNMGMKINNDSNIIFKDPRANKTKFLIEGLAFFDLDKEYKRLPKDSNNILREDLKFLANMPSGGKIRFRTDSKKIVVRVKNSSPYFMPHMAKTGQKGLDIYYKEKGFKKYMFYTSTSFNESDEYEVVLFEADNNKIRDFIINLSLYQALDDVKIGIEKESKLYKPRSHKNDGKIVIYGTSITQGGCATRPGMSFTNILSRKMDYEFINLGFSGNGLGEIELAQIINRIDNLKMIILDYEANGNKDDMLYDTLEPFIDKLREKSKDIPIVVMTKTPFSRDYVNKYELDLRNKFFIFQKEVVEKRNNNGDNNIYFVDGNKLFGKEDIDEFTVDGIHPTDLGFYNEAKNLKPILLKILNKK